MVATAEDLEEEAATVEEEVKDMEAADTMEEEVEDMVAEEVEEVVMGKQPRTRASFSIVTTQYPYT